VESIKNNEFVNVLRHHAGLVVPQDLSCKQDNSLLDREMLEKLKAAISPMIIEAFKSITVHRIEENDTNRHFLMNNIALSGIDIKTDDIAIQMETESFNNLGEDLPNQSHLFVILKNFKTEVKNLDFYYHKKTIPQMIEQGKVTLSEDSSLVLAYNLEQSIGKSPLFHQGKVNFQIHNFELEFEQPLSHDPLVSILTSIVKYQLQRQIEISVSRNLGSLVNGIGEKLTHALKEINKQRIQRMEMNKTEVATENQLEKEIKELYLQKVAKGNKQQMTKFKCRIEDPPRRKHMVFLGGAVLAEIMKDKDHFWMNKSEYQEQGEGVLRKCFS